MPCILSLIRFDSYMLSNFKATPHHNSNAREFFRNLPGNRDESERSASGGSNRGTKRARHFKQWPRPKPLLGEQERAVLPYEISDRDVRGR